eukprot:3115199-Rhodomonas_salina.3
MRRGSDDATPARHSVVRDRGSGCADLHLRHRASAPSCIVTLCQQRPWQMTLKSIGVRAGARRSECCSLVQSQTRACFKPTRVRPSISVLRRRENVGSGGCRACELSVRDALPPQLLQAKRQPAPIAPKRTASSVHGSA